MPTPHASRSIIAATVVVCSLGACLSGCTSRPLQTSDPARGGLASAPVVLPVAQTPPHPVEGSFARTGNVYIAGQPSEAAMRQLKAEGVTLVVNLRTDAEMSNRERVPFDEAALASELGMEYLHLPVSPPDHPYEPRVVDALAQALARHEGKALLHCGVAGRASTVWAGYLVRHKGLTPDEALEHAAAIRPQVQPLADLIDADVVFVPRKRR